MSFSTRLCAWVALAALSFAAWHWSSATDASRDVTHLALSQFQNDNAAMDRLQQASLVQNWSQLAWPALVMVGAGVIFWEQLERLWQNAGPKFNQGSN